MEYITDINQLDVNKKYTYADYLTWRFKERVELIKGKLFKMSPAPKTRHQKVSNNINGEIWTFLKEKPCVVFTAPFDVRLPQKKGKISKTVVQPDICVICDRTKLDERGCVGPPDLIVEILSKSTSKKDLHDKKDLYEENRVLEYWVVHPNDGTLIQFVLNKKTKYEQKGIFTLGDKVPSHALKGFELDMDEIFREPGE